MNRIAGKWTSGFLAAGTACAALVFACGLEEGGVTPSDVGGDDAGKDVRPPPEDAAVDSCVPGPERCNGVDDNCNGTVDEGCPECDDNDVCRLDLLETGRGDSLGPGPFDPEFNDMCHAGGAVIGIYGSTKKPVITLRMRCQKLELRREKLAPEFAYRVKWSAGPPDESWSPHGGSNEGSQSTYNEQCEADKVMVGLDVSADSLYVNGIEFYCARLLVERSPDAYAVKYELPLAAPKKVAGSNSTAAELPPYRAPAPAIFGGLFGKPAGTNTELGAIGSYNRKPELKLITPAP